MANEKQPESRPGQLPKGFPIHVYPAKVGIDNGTGGKK